MIQRDANNGTYLGYDDAPDLSFQGGKMGKTKLRGRAAVVLHVDGGDDFGLDRVTPVGYTFGVVVSQSGDGTTVRVVEDSTGTRHAATTHTHLLPPSILACGLLGAIHTGEVDGSGVASVAQLAEVIRGIIHTAGHRAMCARHDLRDGCVCDARGWRA